MCIMHTIYTEYTIYLYILYILYTLGLHKMPTSAEWSQVCVDVYYIYHVYYIYTY